MKVFIVVRGIKHEGAVIEAVYDTVEKAINYLARHGWKQGLYWDKWIKEDDSISYAYIDIWEVK